MSAIFNDKEIQTKSIQIGGCGWLTVECGSNGYDGGDSGHGGKAVVCIDGGDDADFNVSVSKSNKYRDKDNCLEIRVGGDCEMENLADALLWMSRVLKSQLGNPLDRYVNTDIDDIGGQKAYNKYEKFYHYLCDLLSHYQWEKSLRNMSDYAKKHHCKGVTKEQFFQNGLHNKLSITEKEATELYDKIFKNEKK